MASDVLEGVLRALVAADASAVLDPYVLADLTLDRLRTTIGAPPNADPIRDHIAWVFSEWTRTR